MRRFGVKVHSNTYLKQTEGAWPFCVASVIHRRATLRRQDLAAEMFDFCCQPSKQSTLMLMKGSSAKLQNGYNPGDGKMVSDEGKIAGIGVVFGRSDDQADPAMYILKLHPNGPAARIGLLGPMQELISVNGWNVHGQDIPSVMQRVKGQAGTKVLTIAFKGRKILKVEITREPLAPSYPNGPGPPFPDSTDGQPRPITSSKANLGAAPALLVTRPGDSNTIKLKQLQALALNESYFDNLARESPISARYELTTQGIYQVDEASGTLIPLLTSPPARPGRGGSPARSTTPSTAAQPDFVYGGRVCSNPNEKDIIRDASSVLSHGGNTLGELLDVFNTTRTTQAAAAAYHSNHRINSRLASSEANSRLASSAAINSRLASSAYHSNHRINSRLASSAAKEDVSPAVISQQPDIGPAFIPPSSFESAEWQWA